MPTWPPALTAGTACRRGRYASPLRTRCLTPNWSSRPRRSAWLPSRTAAAAAGTAADTRACGRVARRSSRPRTRNPRQGPRPNVVDRRRPRHRRPRTDQGCSAAAALRAPSGRGSGRHSPVRGARCVGRGVAARQQLVRRSLGCSRHSRVARSPGRLGGLAERQDRRGAHNRGARAQKLPDRPVCDEIDEA